MTGHTSAGGPGLSLVSLSTTMMLGAEMRRIGTRKEWM